MKYYRLKTHCSITAIRERCVLILLVSLCVFGSASPLQAATLYFGTTSQDQRTGSPWEVGVFIDTQEVRANAIQGEIEYDPGRWSVENIETGSSVVSLWVESPALPNHCSNTCRIPFEGVIPGGVVGSRLELFRLVGRSVRSGQVTMTSLNTRVLAHDGQGTVLPITVAPITVRVATGVEAEPYVRLSDVTPPEPFTIEVARDPLVLDGKWFIVFETQDKGSGIDRYEWQESLGDPIASAWKRAERPQLLADQSRAGRVYVRAIDRMGNIRLATEANAERFDFVNVKNVLFLFGVLLILLLLWSRSRARRR